MSDILRDIYQSAGKLDHYFDKQTPPLDLYRCQSPEDHKNDVFILEPNLGPGRTPDVRIEERDGKKFVLGCRAVSGRHHTGVSTFDKPVRLFGPQTINFLIPSNTPLPDNLAVTKDRFNTRQEATHYTVAPKDDMPWELFVQSLKAVAAKAVKHQAQ